MLYKILASIAVASLPVMAHAQIYSSTSAAADSGGNVAGPGGRIETGGASASVSTSNSSASGTSHSSVYIRANSDGAVREESYTSSSTDVSVSVQSTPEGTVVETREGAAPAVKKIIPASPNPAHITAQAKGAAGAHAEIAATPVVPTASSTVPVAPSIAPASLGVPREQDLGLGARIALSIQAFFAGLFSWLK